MKKTLALITVLSLALALSSVAGWIADPMDVSLPTPTLSATVQATGSVTSVAIPAATQRYVISVSAGPILPAASGNTATLRRIASGGAVTNAYVFTNGAASASAGVWLDPADTFALELSESVTNLPVVTYLYIASPATTNYTCYAGDQWQICGARPASAILPEGATNVFGVSYVGGASEPLAAFTNGSPAYLPSVPVWLSLFDSVTLAAHRVTNSPTFRITRLRWN